MASMRAALGVQLAHLSDVPRKIALRNKFTDDGLLRHSGGRLEQDTSGVEFLGQRTRDHHIA